MEFTESEIRELRYVLASFKQELPAHEVDRWYITSHSEPSVIEDTTGTFRLGATPEGWIRVSGYGECSRCNRRFEPRAWNNRKAWDDDSLVAAIAGVKERILEVAGRRGPCWGGLPEPPHKRSAAVADSVAAMREP